MSGYRSEETPAKLTSNESLTGVRISREDLASLLGLVEGVLRFSENRLDKYEPLLSRVRALLGLTKM